MRIKRILSLLAAAAMTVTSLTGAMTASASEVANGTCGDLTWTLDSDGKLTISGEGEMASPNVKNVIGKYDSMSEVYSQLGDYSDIYTYKKEHKEDIKEVVIGDGVTTIGFCAFYKMPNLMTVVLPSSIRVFKGVGFDRRQNKPNYIDNINAYASYAFAECTSLKNLTLTEGMTAIGSYAFYGCTSLESVRIPSTLLDDSANLYQSLEANCGWEIYSFAECSKLKNITLPEGLTSIGGGAFIGTAVESVVIPSTIEKWSMAGIEDRKFPATDGNSTNINGAFAYCEKLSSVTFKDGIKTLFKSSLIYNCPKLKRITIPKSVTNMQYAFQCCTSLEEVYIEEGTQISSYNGSSNSYFDRAFDYCTNLKRIEIPEGVYLGSNFSCFEECNSLEEVYIHSKSTSASKIPVNSKIKFYVYNDSGTYDALSKDSSTFNKIYDISEAITKAHGELNKAVNEAKAYTEDKYTAESYGALKTALENAKKYDENYTGVMAMQWAAEDINNAINSLVKKPAQDSVKPGAAKPSTDNKITNTKSQAQKNAENAMKQAKITKLTVKSKAKKKITVTWKKVSKANGYQVQVSTNKKFKKSKIILTKTTSKKKITIKKLKSKKTYFVRVRAYATYKDSNGKPQKVYSSWIKKTRKVKVK